MEWCIFLRTNRPSRVNCITSMKITRDVILAFSPSLLILLFHFFSFFVIILRYFHCFIWCIYKMPTALKEFVWVWIYVCVCMRVCFGTIPTVQKDTRKVLREILARSASFSTMRDKIILVKFLFFSLVCLPVPTMVENLINLITYKQHASKTTKVA